MPAWIGWNESDVRQNQNSATLGADQLSYTLSAASPPVPDTQRFTPINAPKRATRQASKTGWASTPSCDGQVPTEADAGDRQTIYLVSAYLGRGDAEIELPMAKQTPLVSRASVSENNRTAAKKRATTIPNQSVAKRVRITDVSESMPVTKTGPIKAKGKGKATKQNKHNEREAVDGRISSQPVSLFSSSTSMGYLTAPLQQTSLDAVRASQGYGTTLYQGPRGSHGHHSDSRGSRPWLVQRAANSKPVEAADHGVVSSPPKQQLTCSQRAVRAPRTLSEDFMIGEDEGLEDAMALADSLEAKSNHLNSVKSFSDSNKFTYSLKSKIEDVRPHIGPDQNPGSVLQSSRSMTQYFPIGEDEELDETSSVLAEIEVGVETPPKQKYTSTTRKRLVRPQNTTICGISKPAKAIESSKDTREQPNLSSSSSTEPDEFERATKDASRFIDNPAAGRPPTPPARQWKLNMREVNEHEDYGGALFTEAERQILDSIRSDERTGPKPFVRKPFPRPILDRSPLFGASFGAALRTCFRIGEALKAGSHAVRLNNVVIIELYARVISSSREGRKQHFVFHDLYHDRPPYLEGTCELWNQSKLWELDTRSFLDAEKRREGVMCRAVAKMKKKEVIEGKGWKLEVLSIWEAGWEDVDYVAGIYGKVTRGTADEDRR